MSGVDLLGVIDVEPQPGELQHFPLPRSLKRRLRYVALMYVVMMSLLLSVIWAAGLNMIPWVIVAVVPAVLGVYLVSNATVTVRMPSEGSTPNPTEIDEEFEAVASPFTPKIIGLLVLLVVVMAGTAIIVKQSAVPDSPELIEAQAVCRASWADFEENETLTSQQSWTECLLRNPSLASDCGLSGQLAGAMLGVKSINEVQLASSDLRACGKTIY